MELAQDQGAKALLPALTNDPFMTMLESIEEPLKTRVGKKNGGVSFPSENKSA